MDSGFSEEEFFPHGFGQGTFGHGRPVASEFFPVTVGKIEHVDPVHKRVPVVASEEVVRNVGGAGHGSSGESEPEFPVYSDKGKDVTGLNVYDIDLEGV